MIGNDIVDLKLASTSRHWNSQRFLDKVFTCDEQITIKNATDHFKTIWLLWSMKESAYKIYMQQYQNPFFAPTKIVCQLSEESDGLVEIDHNRYTTTSQITDDCIYTYARLGHTRNVISKYSRLNEAAYSLQHLECYQSILRTYSRKSGIHLEDLKIQKNEVGIPELFVNKIKLSESFSITHHGHYYAYALSA